MSNETKANIEEEAIIAMLTMRASALGEKDAKRALSYETEDSVEFSLAPPLVYHGNVAGPADVVRHLGRSDRWRCARFQADGRRRRCFLEWSDAHDGN
jgi:hypothetical protein